jgi:hypothetical protein
MATTTVAGLERGNGGHDGRGNGNGHRYNRNGGYRRCDYSQGHDERQTLGGEYHSQRQVYRAVSDAGQKPEEEKVTCSATEPKSDAVNGASASESCTVPPASASQNSTTGSALTYSS